MLTPCALIAGSLLLPGAEALAEERVDSGEAGALLVERADPIEARPPVRITIGPQSVQPGETRYAERSTVAGKAAIVVFSTSPRRSTLNPASGTMPTGMPVAARLTSAFGWRTHPIHGGVRAHAGVDLAAPYGSPVVATGNGVVGSAAWAGGLGLTVSVLHGDGVQTRYGHLSRLNVVAGQQVSRGDVIGYVGSTGQSTGPHVHYEMRINGTAVDPLSR